MSDPIEPDDPDVRFHAAWLAQLSEGADGLVSKQVPKHDGGNTSVSAISSNPAVRLVGHDVPPPQLPRLGRRSGLIVIVLIGLVFALALAAVSAIPQHLWLSENWHQLTDDRTMGLTWSEPSTSAIHAIQNEPSTPKLIVQSSRGVSGEPAPIALALRGNAYDAVVLIRGLVPGMELSAGGAVSGDTWQLSPTDLPYAWIAPPDGFVGSADLVAELRLPNAQIADRQMLHLEWTRPAAVPELQHEQEQITRQKEVEPVPPIAPPTVAHSNDRDVTTAAPPSSADPLQGQLGRKEGKSARARGKNNLRRSSVNDGSPAAPSVSPRVGDNTRPLKGFWDWSR